MHVPLRCRAAYRPLHTHTEPCLPLFAGYYDAREFRRCRQRSTYYDILFTRQCARQVSNIALGRAGERDFGILGDKNNTSPADVGQWPQSARC